MLTLYHNGEQHVIQDTEYYVRELANGLDEVIFSLDIHDPIYAIIAEEENIVDRAGQTYKVKQIDAGARDAKIVCQLDIDDWRATLNVDYNSGTKTVNQQINAVKPAGWTVVDRALINIGRTIEGDLTPYDVCVRCTEVYSVYIRWNNKTKECTIYPKAMAAPVGAFATKELNLKEINYKGKSNDLVTRLYCYGKDGLTIQGATIGGTPYPYPYVENFAYTNKVICAIWRDERYTVVEDLYNDAVEKLKTMSRPDRTYECSIVDLQATNPELYNNLDFSLFTTASLIDDIKETSVDYQVVERHIYPYHPDKNEVIFNSEPLKITATVVNIVDSIENPSSTFQQIQAQRIASATNWLTSGDGYVVARKGTNGEWKELLFMDTPDEATAQKVIRINENGIGFSTTGVNGPYRNAWTIDGQLVADFITTGTLNADLVTVHGKIEATSGYFQSGYFGTGQDWELTANGFHSKNGPTASYGQNTVGSYVGKDGFCCNGANAHTWISDGAITSTGGMMAGEVISTGVVSAGTNLQAGGGVTAGGTIYTSSGAIQTANGDISTLDGDIITNTGRFAAKGYAGVSDKQISWTDSSGNGHSIIVKGGIVTAMT